MIPGVTLLELVVLVDVNDVMEGPTLEVPGNEIRDSSLTYWSPGHHITLTCILKIRRGIPQNVFPYKLSADI